MVYGSLADVKLVEQYISLEEFRQALGHAPAEYLRKMLGSGGTENFGLNLFRHCRGAGFQMVARDRKLGDSSGDRLFLGTGVRHSVRWRPFVVR